MLRILTAKQNIAWNDVRQDLKNDFYVANAYIDQYKYLLPARAETH